MSTDELPGDLSAADEAVPEAAPDTLSDTLPDATGPTTGREVEALPGGRRITYYSQVGAGRPAGT